MTDSEIEDHITALLTQRGEMFERACVYQCSICIMDANENVPRHTAEHKVRSVLGAMFCRGDIKYRWILGERYVKLKPTWSRKRKPAKKEQRGLFEE